MQDLKALLTAWQQSLLLVSLKFSLRTSVSVYDLQGMIPSYFLDVPFLSNTNSLMRGGTKEDPLILTIHESW